MIKEELKKIKFTKREFRDFGILIGGVLVAIAALRLRDSSIFIYLVSSGLVLSLLGLFLPNALRTPYRYWMIFALFIGKIMTTIILTLLYLLAFLPLGLLLKILGKKLINTDKKNVPSYWEQRTPRLKEQSIWEKQY